MSDQGFQAAVLFPSLNGKFLLQHRSETVARWPGYWSCFGGGMEANETKEEALARELREELGYEVREPVFVYSQPIDGGTKHVFTEAWKGDERYTLDMKESTESGWFTIEEARLLQIIPHDLEVLERLAAA